MGAPCATALPVFERKREAINISYLSTLKMDGLFILNNHEEARKRNQWVI
jgi:hypothetical protein